MSASRVATGAMSGSFMLLAMLGINARAVAEEPTGTTTPRITGTATVSQTPTVLPAPKPTPVVVFDASPPLITVLWQSVGPGTKYLLERSSLIEDTGTDFAPIATVTDQGPGSTVAYYDQVPGFGLFCYRTRIIDPIVHAAGPPSEEGCVTIREGDTHLPTPPTVTPTTPGPTITATPQPPSTGSGVGSGGGGTSRLAWLGSGLILLLAGVLITTGRTRR